MVDGIIEIKVQGCNVKFIAWESLPVFSVVTVKTESQFNSVMEEIGKLADSCMVHEVRWNWSGSPHGHYRHNKDWWK